MAYTYEYPRPAVTVDAVVLARDARTAQTHVLLIQRDREPFAGKWALPGGFVEIDEDLEPAVHRELEEETGLKNLSFEQLRTFGRPGRDPRGRTISVAYVAHTTLDAQTARAADDARDARWFPTDALPPLAFDHAEIIARALTKP